MNLLDIIVTMTPEESREFWDNGSLPLQYNPIYDSAPLVVPYKVGQMFYHMDMSCIRLFLDMTCNVTIEGLHYKDTVSNVTVYGDCTSDFNRIKILEEDQNEKVFQELLAMRKLWLQRNNWHPKVRD